MYIYIYIYTYTQTYNFVFFVYCNIAATHTHAHTHIIFSSWFYLVIVTSRNSLPNCENHPISNIASESSYQRCSIKKAVLKNLAILIGKPATLLHRDSRRVVFM